MVLQPPPIQLRNPNNPNNMATKFESNGDGGNDVQYVDHPEGTFLARCVDVWTEEKPNPYKGKISKNPKTGQDEVDMRETLTKVRVKFLTEEVLEIGGKMMPASVLYFGNFSWGDNSGLKRFVAGFAPDIAKLPKWDVDLDDLIGREAMVTVQKWESGDGSSVQIATKVHASMAGQAPAIPADFKRRSERLAQSDKGAQAKPAQPTNEPSDQPF